MHNITVESEVLLHLVTGSASEQELTRMNILFAYRRMLLIIMINILGGKCTMFCHKVKQECIQIEYVSLQLLVQNAVSAQLCVRILQIFYSMGTMK